MERLPTPDPVAEAAEYQRYLTGLVGDDDPADVQAGSAAAWREVLQSAGARVAERPEPDEWSVLECLGHVTDSELVVASRYRWIVAQDEPPLVGYDQDLWVDRLHAPLEPAEELLAFFEPMRAANLALWARTPEDRRDRFGVHAERGRESYRLTFVLIAGHDRFHLAQAERALDAVAG